MANLIKGLLTIGIPTYNGGANLPELLESVKNLGLEKGAYEVVVLDNFSTDDTAQIMERLQSTFGELTYHKNSSNIGRIENWNRVIELARGEFLILMNVNDRFSPFNLKVHLEYLAHHPQIPLLMTDIQYANHVYPNWLEYGIINLEAYLRKIFIESEYLEFHALGVLQQNIFRTEILLKSAIRFDPKLPRTTDRILTAEVIKAGGGNFYYINQCMVKWRANKSRYHSSIHQGQKDFNMEELWLNEYKANVHLAGLVHMSYQEILQSQLILAAFFKYRKQAKNCKNLFSRQTNIELEITTASVFYEYLKALAELNNVSIKFIHIKLKALGRTLRWYLRSVHLLKENQRSLGNNVIHV
jgi:glycosyltransferase involved in cell wall biosynthesis